MNVRQELQNDLDNLPRFTLKQATVTNALLERMRPLSSVPHVLFLLSAVQSELIFNGSKSKTKNAYIRAIRDIQVRYRPHENYVPVRDLTLGTFVGFRTHLHEVVSYDKEADILGLRNVQSDEVEMLTNASLGNCLLRVIN
jgi:hypothetical protein